MLFVEMLRSVTTFLNVYPVHEPITENISSSSVWLHRIKVSKDYHSFHIKRDAELVSMQVLNDVSSPQ